MTSISASEATPRMVNPSDTASEAPAEQASARARTAAAARPSLRGQVAENPLLSFFGLLIVALLAAAIASPHIRIDDLNLRIDDVGLRIDDLRLRIDETNERIDRTNERIDRTNERIDRTNERIDRLEEKVDARFDALEAAVAEIDRKLTALIAHLNATNEVDDALAGRLTGPSASGAPDTSDDDPG